MARVGRWVELREEWEQVEPDLTNYLLKSLSDEHRKPLAPAGRVPAAGGRRLQGGQQESIEDNTEGMELPVLADMLEQQERTDLRGSG